MKKWITGCILVICLMLLKLPIPAKAATEFPEFNVPDKSKWSLTTVDGKKINEKTYEGKLRCFVFVQSGCLNSSSAMKGIANREWLTNEDLQVIVVYSKYNATQQDVEKYIKEVIPSNKGIVFAYGNDSMTMDSYYMGNTVKPKELMYAMAVVVDQNNVIRYAANSIDIKVRSLFENAIDKYLYRIEPKDMITFDIKGTFDYDEATEVFQQLNALRASLGLKALTMDKDLMDVAMQRAAESSIYYSHTRPNGETCFSLFPSGSRVMAENIAAGQANATEVMNSWKNSPGHYKNMTQDNIDAVGLGCFYQNGVKYWVQVFDGGRSTSPDNRSGKEVKKAQISALGENLNISIKSPSSDVGLGLQEKFELCNTNKTISYGITSIVFNEYASSDTSIAKIDVNGMVTGVKPGDAWITLGINKNLYWRTLVHSLNNYTFTFDANGGKGTPEPQIKLHNRPMYINKNIPVRDGYEFIGWSTNPNAKGISMYGAGGRVEDTINQDMYLYAVWNEKWFYITYDTNGGTGYIPITTQFADRAETIRTQTPTKTGYQFMGWATKKDATVAEYQPGDKITVFVNTTLYAVWALPTYTITYDASGGTGAPEPQIKNQSQNITLSSIVPTKEGDTFLGWAYVRGGSPVYQPGDILSENRSFTLFAAWKSDQKTYTVTFMDWDGKVLASQTVGEGQAAVAPASPSRTGYKFRGWDKTFSYVTGNLTVTALYELDASASQNNTQIVTPVGSYGISVSPSDLVMNSVTEGNYLKVPYILTVTNTGSKSTGQLKVSLSGPNASSFEINKTSMLSILAGKTGSIMVTPKLLLKAGTYTATITISGTNIPATKVNVSFTVNKKVNTTPVITITNQPADTTTVYIGNITETLKVAASVSNGKAVRYQWAISKSGKTLTSGSKITGATSDTFKIPKDLKEGKYYYYCIVSADGAKDVRTIVAEIVVKYKDAPVITIDSQPPDEITVTQGKITEKLIVAASVTNGRTLKYQWAVSKTGKNPPTGTKITGATTKSFSVPSNLKKGTYYYFCVLTAEGAKEVRTNVVKVIVK